MVHPSKASPITVLKAVFWLLLPQRLGNPKIQINEQSPREDSVLSEGFFRRYSIIEFELLLF